ncbi:hypothetical protein TorRG33x02_329020 [Trema orientale]|uniref:Transmembrane protein n=1 Tax=Trema orientale TaxID=63057 RepID=A0A2P5B9A3_TREOI|nr:hypothetical protein TorRG33x02_329020 [Trema orientale]
MGGGRGKKCCKQTWVKKLEDERKGREREREIIIFLSIIYFSVKVTGPMTCDNMRSESTGYFAATS